MKTNRVQFIVTKLGQKKKRKLFQLPKGMMQNVFFLFRKDMSEKQKFYFGGSIWPLNPNLLDKSSCF